MCPLNQNTVSLTVVANISVLHDSLWLHSIWLHSIWSPKPLNVYRLLQLHKEFRVHPPFPSLTSTMEFLINRVPKIDYKNLVVCFPSRRSVFRRMVWSYKCIAFMAFLNHLSQCIHYLSFNVNHQRASPVLSSSVYDGKTQIFDCR